MSYSNDRQWSDLLIPHMKHIIGPRLLDVSSFDVDTKEATDLIVFKAGSVAISARVRKYSVWKRYPYDVTMRYSRPTGTETEFSKIMNGFGDWMFYGFADAETSARKPPREPGVKYRIQYWSILDLEAFRYLWQYERNTLKYTRQVNTDKTEFWAFDIRSMPSVLLKSNHIEIPTVHAFANT
jgi:hypothetical protein